MKAKKNFLTSTVAIVGALILLGVCSAQAATVRLDPQDPTNANGIDNLVVEGYVFQIDFVYDSSDNVHGALPPFNFAQEGLLSIGYALTTIVNDILNTEPGVQTVGPPDSGLKSSIYYLAFAQTRKIEEFTTVATNGQYSDGVGWDLGEGVYNLQPPFGPGYDLLPQAIPYYYPTIVWPPSNDLVTIGGTVTGLEGSGLVLQNNGGDDESISANGPFTFDTVVEPGTSYNVTVKTQPSNPAQTCSVANGSGTVPSQPVTNVAVTCVEPELAGIKKVAAEGDTLGDTVLKYILLNGGVAINIEGQVAFGGIDGNGNKAAFTQTGKVVGEGDTLEDDTILAAFRGQGEVAISTGRSGDRVAFHGKAEAGSNDTDAVFTQAGKIAAVGDTISADTTVDDIAPEGKVAINNFFYQVAFHGKVEIDSGPGKERPHAVFIADGVDTQVAAQENSNLPDSTPLGLIIDSGGVAINEWAEVAFHGDTNTFRAVFTQDKVIAKVGDTLSADTTVEYIYDDGGVAINFFGEVAFLGKTEAVNAVFISDGETTQVVAKAGDTLPDGNTLTGIEVSGGVAINSFGEVAFHGYTSDGKAVFTQNGVVAKVGDFLDDGDPLNDIWTDGGVAINPYGPEVAFHGQAGTPDAVTDAVLVGQAPVAGGE